MSVVVSVVLLTWAIIGAFVTPASPALNRASNAVNEQGATVSEVAVDDDEPTLTPTVAHLAAWSRSTPTPIPAEQPPVEDLPVRGPRELRLWDGTAMAVEPATVEAGRDAHHWHLSGDTGAVGWHTDTPDCGDEGVVVMGGHVAYDGVPGPLAALADVGTDDAVTCVDHDGQTHRYVPQDYLMSSVEDDVTSWHPTWQPALILYTCTPDLDGTLLVVRFALESAVALES
jgi:hypothetical protein